MFNPSTGGVDNTHDKTIRKIFGLMNRLFPHQNGFKIINLFAYKTPYPLNLLEKIWYFNGYNHGGEDLVDAFNEVVGIGNEPTGNDWEDEADGAQSIVAAWGNL